MQLRGIDIDIVREISARQNEDEWMLSLRLRALELFYTLAKPSWGPDLSALDISQLSTFVASMHKSATSWEEVPDDIKRTFDALGIPEAEKRYLSGVGAQFDSETVYHSLKKDLADKGVIFTDMTQALHEHTDLVRTYFSSVLVPDMHVFMALHYALWSGGTFLYVPQGVSIDEPLQSYFRMNTASSGQFEHTLIVLEAGSSATYIEGCSAPKYGTSSLHAGGVEIVLAPHARMKYISIENWSLDTYNLNTKKAMCDSDTHMEWISGSLGSHTTMLYPCSVLRGDRSSTRFLSLSYAQSEQTIDTGAKTIHIGTDTNASIFSKSLVSGGGMSIYRGLSVVQPTAQRATIHSECDSLIIDDTSGSDAFPRFDIARSDAQVTHEAHTGRLDEDAIHYLTSRGILQNEAKSMLVNGFFRSIVEVFPLEYATEMNALFRMLFAK